MALPAHRWDAQNRDEEHGDDGRRDGEDAATPQTHSSPYTHKANSLAELQFGQTICGQKEKRVRRGPERWSEHKEVCKKKLGSI